MEKIGISGYIYKDDEDCIERLKNKLSTMFLAIEASKCEEDIIKDAINVLPEVLMLIQDIEDELNKNQK